MAHAEILLPEFLAVAMDHSIGLLEKLLMLVGMQDACRMRTGNGPRRHADKEQRDERPEHATGVSERRIEDRTSKKIHSVVTARDLCRIVDGVLDSFKVESAEQMW